MQLTLHGLGQVVAGQVHLYPLDLALEPGQVTVLFGATQAGKTSLMRLMAGLDRPSQGQVRVDGRDVTGIPVRKRQVSMVYQQFINYPSMSVYDNIASPLRLAGHRALDARVRQLADTLQLTAFLDRLPASLSGGQQQRVALARALAKNAPLMLLDEPLVNLDYKLREALRDELTHWFAQGDTTVVYASTEPAEALQMGGHTAVLDQGRLLQYGRTVDVFHRPQSIRVAQAFSDPPINLLPAERSALGVRCRNGLALPMDLPPSTPADLVLGVRAGALRTNPGPDDIRLSAEVELADISGSETLLHVQTPLAGLVAELPGVHKLALGTQLTICLDPASVYVFDAQGPLVRAPSSQPWQERR